MSKKVRIFFEVFADAGNVNAQSLNARGLAVRLDPEHFQSSFVFSGYPDPQLVGKSHIRLIVLPPRLRAHFVKLYLLCSSNDLVVYPSDYFHTPFFSKILRRSRRRKKVIYPLEGTIDNLKGENPRAFKRICRILKESDLVVPISAYTSRNLKQEIGIESPTIIPLGIDTQFFCPVKRRAQSFVQVLFAGRLIARKGLEQVVEAAALFARVQFRIVGSAYGKEDGAFAQRIRQRVEADGLSNVTFMGTLSQEQLRQLMWESDILLHPSSVEGIPRVTLEAGATGMPSIVYDYYQTPSVVDGITGFQVKTFDEMMDRLRLLAEDRDLRWQMGEAAVEHVKQFDWGVLAKRWEVVFRELAPN